LTKRPTLWPYGLIMFRFLLVLCFGLTKLQLLSAASSTFYGTTPYPMIAPVSTTTFQATGFFPTSPFAGTGNTKISPDGKTVFVETAVYPFATSCAPATCFVTAVAIATSKTVQTYNLTYTPTGPMTVLPDESKLFVATCLGGIGDIDNDCTNVYVEVFDIASGVEQAVIPITLYSDQNPAGQIHQLTPAPNGAAVYLDDVLCTGLFESSGCAGFIMPINAATLQVGASFNFCILQCEENPLVISADSKTGYIFAGAGEEGDSAVIDIVDLTQMIQTGSIPLPSSVFGGSIAISADGSTLAVNLPNYPTPQALLFIDTATEAITSTVEGVLNDPVTLSPDGGSAYIPTMVAGLQVVSLKTGTITTELADLPVLALSPSMNGTVLNLLVGAYPSRGLFNTGGVISYPEGSAAPKVFEAGLPVTWLAISPDDETLYSANANGISVVSTATGTVTSQMLPGANVVAVAVSSDGSTLYALSAAASSFTVLNSSTGAVEGAVTIPPCSGASTGSIALEPVGGWAFVMLNCGSVVPINLTTLTAGLPLPHTSGSALAVSPRGAYLYAGAGSSVVVINLTTGQVAATIPMTASSIAFSPSGKWAYLVGTSTSNNEQGMGVVDTSTLSLATFVPLANAGGLGESIAVSRDGLFIYVGAATQTQPQPPVQVAVVNALTLKVAQYLLSSPPFLAH
jgi:hypothetical protein